jgi:hypothetical protein
LRLLPARAQAAHVGSRHRTCRNTSASI